MSMSAIKNPVLLLTLGLPLAAVLASVATTIVAVARGDAPLPEQYHWEGVKLDRDFSRAQRAQELGVVARIDGLSNGGVCTLTLQSDAVAAEDVLLSIVHSTLPALDQTLLFRKVGGDTGAAVYEAPCQALAEGSWRLGLDDRANGWALRRIVRGSPATITFDARSG
jgi:hypothetical protein